MRRVHLLLAVSLRAASLIHAQPEHTPVDGPAVHFTARNAPSVTAAPAHDSLADHGPMEWFKTQFKELKSEVADAVDDHDSNCVGNRFCTMDRSCLKKSVKSGGSQFCSTFASAQASCLTARYPYASTKARPFDDTLHYRHGVCSDYYSTYFATATATTNPIANIGNRAAVTQNADGDSTNSLNHLEQGFLSQPDLLNESIESFEHEMESSAHLLQRNADLDHPNSNAANISSGDTLLDGLLRPIDSTYEPTSDEGMPAGKLDPRTPGNSPSYSAVTVPLRDMGFFPTPTPADRPHAPLVTPSGYPSDMSMFVPSGLSKGLTTTAITSGNHKTITAVLKCKATDPLSYIVTVSDARLTAILTASVKYYDDRQSMLETYLANGTTTVRSQTWSVPRPTVTPFNWSKGQVLMAEVPENGVTTTQILTVTATEPPRLSGSAYVRGGLTQTLYQTVKMHQGKATEVVRTVVVDDSHNITTRYPIVHERDEDDTPILPRGVAEYQLSVDQVWTATESFPHGIPGLATLTVVGLHPPRFSGPFTNQAGTTAEMLASLKMHDHKMTAVVKTFAVGSHIAEIRTQAYPPVRINNKERGATMAAAASLESNRQIDGRGVGYVSEMEGMEREVNTGEVVFITVLDQGFSRKTLNPPSTTNSQASTSIVTVVNFGGGSPYATIVATTDKNGRTMISTLPFTKATVTPAVPKEATTKTVTVHQTTERITTVTSTMAEAKATGTVGATPLHGGQVLAARAVATKSFTEPANATVVVDQGGPSTPAVVLQPLVKCDPQNLREHEWRIRDAPDLVDASVEQLQARFSAHWEAVAALANFSQSLDPTLSRLLAIKLALMCTLSPGADFVDFASFTMVSNTEYAMDSASTIKPIPKLVFTNDPSKLSTQDMGISVSASLPTDVANPRMGPQDVLFRSCGKHDDKRDCQKEQCMWRHRKPMVITTVLPAWMATNGSAVMDYFTRMTTLRLDEHWGTTKSSGLYYPWNFTTGLAINSTIVRHSTGTTTSYQSVLTTHAVRQTPWYVGKEAHGPPACYDEASCYDDCHRRAYKSHGKQRKVAIAAGVVGGLVGLLALLACCLCCGRHFHRSSQKSTEKRTEVAPAMAVRQVDSTTGRPVDAATAAPMVVQKIGEGPGAAAVVASEGRGTMGRQAEEGRSRVHFPEGGEKKVEQVSGKAPTGTEKVVQAPMMGADQRVVKDGKGSEHIEKVPAHDGADESHRTGREVMEVGSMRGRKRSRPDGKVAL